MDEQINTPIEQQPQAEPMPDWNTPKPVEDELNKYGAGKGLKVFLVVGFLVILAAIGLFVYQTMVKGKTPAEQLQREPITEEVKKEQPVTKKRPRKSRLKRLIVSILKKWISSLSKPIWTTLTCKIFRYP